MEIVDATHAKELRAQAQSLMDRVYDEDIKFWPYGISAAPERNPVLLVAESKHDVVGWIGLSEMDSEIPGEDKRVTYYSIGVDPSARKSGVATKLINAAKSRCKGELRAWIIAGNAPSRKLAIKHRIPYHHELHEPMIRDFNKTAATGPRAAGILRGLGMLGGGAAAAGGMDYIAHDGDYSHVGKGRIANALINTMLGAVGVHNLQGPNKNVVGAMTALIGMPTKDAIMALNETIPKFNRLIDLHNKPAVVPSNLEKYGPMVGKGLLGVGGVLALAGMANSMRSAANARTGGRVQVRLPSRGKNDPEAMVDLPVDDANLSPSLLRAIGTDTRRKLRTEVRSRVQHRNDEDDDIMENPYAKAAATIFKIAAMHRANLGIPGGFTPVQQPGTSGNISAPKSQNPASLGTVAASADRAAQEEVSAEGKGSAESNSIAGDIAQQKAQQEQLKTQGMIADLHAQNAELRGQVSSAPKAALATAPFESGVIGHRLDTLGKKINSIVKQADWVDRLADSSSNSVMGVGASFMPITGNIMAGARSISDFRKGNYGSAALNAVGAIPGVGTVAGWAGRGLSALGRFTGLTAKAAPMLAKAAPMMSKVAPSVSGVKNLSRQIGMGTSALDRALNDDGAPPAAPSYAGIDYSGGWNSMNPFKTAAEYEVAGGGGINLKSPTWDRMKKQYGDVGAGHILNSRGSVAGVKFTSPYAAEWGAQQATGGAANWIQKKLRGLSHLPMVSDHAINQVPKFAPRSMLGLDDAPSAASAPGVSIGGIPQAQLLELINSQYGGY